MNGKSITTALGRRMLAARYIGTLIERARSSTDSRLLDRIERLIAAFEAEPPTVTIGPFIYGDLSAVVPGRVLPQDAYANRTPDDDNTLDPRLVDPQPGGE